MTATQIVKAERSKANTRSRKEWAVIIAADWRKSIDAILATCKSLVAAHDELGQTEFYEMVREDLPFSPRVAGRLMKIGRDDRIINSPSSASLPQSWRILEMLTSMSDEDFEWARERGLISQKTSLRGAEAIKGARSVPEGEAWGAARKPSTLPPPSEARTIARETGRGVAASDGHTYFGASKEEEETTAHTRELIYGVRRAISDLANMEVPPDELLDLAQDWQGWRFDEAHEIITALEWLQELKDEWEARNGPIARQD